MSARRGDLVQGTLDMLIRPQWLFVVHGGRAGTIGLAGVDALC
ncbi:MAG TPA: hypothetical protein VK525_10455 [Candidatus Saccharimonadales bacterium]|nr:hypothetical protein [Candidatus Saccharimonadales bacterium]